MAVELTYHQNSCFLLLYLISILEFSGLLYCPSLLVEHTPYLNVISESTLCCLTLCMQHDGGAPAAVAAPYRRTSDGSAA